MRDRRVALAWAAFVVVALVSCVLVLRRPDRLSDLHIYYGALSDLHAGKPLYEFVAENGGPFTYPPFAALVLWPITAVSEGVLQGIWLVATCAAVVAIAGTVGVALTTRRSRRPLVVALAATVLMLSAPVQSNLRFGQVSIFIVLLALLDGMGVVPPRLRGTLVGVAAAIKLTPLLFVVYFLAVGRYRDAGRVGGHVRGLRGARRDRAARGELDVLDRDGATDLADRQSGLAGQPVGARNVAARRRRRDGAARALGRRWWRWSARRRCCGPDSWRGRAAPGTPPCSSAAPPWPRPRCPGPTTRCGRCSPRCC